MVVPYCEFPLALVHFTGSGHLNRSMRSKADKMVRGKKKPVELEIQLTKSLPSFLHQGMSLSEHAMCTGVIRKVREAFRDITNSPKHCIKCMHRMA